MATFIGDQNKVVIHMESGLYASPSGPAVWVGQVQNNEIDEEENVFETRYVGAGNRNIGTFDTGPFDVNGTIEYIPQDWRMLYLSLGSVNDAGSPSPYTHSIGEINSNALNGVTSGTKNPFISFTLDDSENSAGSAFRRTINGCVIDSFNLTIEEGELATCKVDYIGQSLTYTESAGSTIVPGSDSAGNSLPTYKWNNFQIQIPSGTSIDNIKKIDFKLKNNFLKPHYLNGSRVIDVPQAQNRDYELVLTKNSEDQSTRTLYNSYFKGGSTFNAMLQGIASTGSAEVYIIMSGCRLLDMKAPTGNQSEPNEQDITIKPQTVNANVNDLVFKYAAF